MPCKSEEERVFWGFALYRGRLLLGVLWLAQLLVKGVKVGAGVVDVPVVWLGRGWASRLVYSTKYGNV